MNAQWVRDRLAVARELRSLADKVQEEAIENLTLPKPGSIVRDVRTGTLHKVYDQVGELKVDVLSTGGLTVPDDWSFYDVVQVPGFESDEDVFKRHGLSG